MRHLLYTLLLFAVATSPKAEEPRRFFAPLEQSDWSSTSDGSLCHLSHDIPYFGVAVFSEDESGRIAMAIHSPQTGAEIQAAEVISVAPSWKGASRYPLEQTRVHKDGALLRFGHFSARRLLAELEAGRVAAVRMTPIAGDRPIEVGLSPVLFRAGLREHQACLRQLQGPARGVSHTLTDPYHLLGYRAAAAAPAALAPAGELAVVHFATDTAGLDRDAMDRLIALAQMLQSRYRAGRILIEAYTDDRGTERYNAGLGQRRAEQVKAELVRLGVSAERFVVRVHPGGSQPADGAESYAHATKRRVVVRIMTDAVASAHPELQ